jgi:hypothetical protein
MSDASRLAAERRRLRADFEARERARMGLAPKPTPAWPVRGARRADAEAQRLADMGWSDEVARPVVRESEEAWERFTPEDRLLARFGIVPGGGRRRHRRRRVDRVAANRGTDND